MARPINDTGGFNRREFLHYTGIARFGVMNVMHFHS